jgi:cyanuric acid amidohydrolase
MRCDVIRIPTNGPGDVSGVARLIQAGALDPATIVAVMGKTEGNGCVNDYTRDFATTQLTALLGRALGVDADAVQRRVAIVMSGGTEGVLSPHLTIFSRGPSLERPAPGAKRLAIGTAHTRDFLPEEIGRRAQIHETAAAVRRAMADAGISSADDLHLVQVKCPLLTSERIAGALARSRSTATRDTYESMALSRGASAFGIGVATGEIDAAAATDAAVLNDATLASSVASASAGIELLHNVIIAIGMSATASSPYLVAHGVMRDAVDAEAVRVTLAAAGVDAGSAAERVVNVFAKAEASPDGAVRGARHTMLNDSDIHSTRHARAAVGAVIASVVGSTALYVSGGAEHQGPPGGGPVAIIVRA